MQAFGHRIRTLKTHRYAFGELLLKSLSLVMLFLRATNGDEICEIRS